MTPGRRVAVGAAVAGVLAVPALVASGQSTTTECGPGTVDVVAGSGWHDAARRAGVSPAALKACNPWVDEVTLDPGDLLLIPDEEDTWTSSTSLPDGTSTTSSSIPTTAPVTTTTVTATTSTVATPSTSTTVPSLSTLPSSPEFVETFDTAAALDGWVFEISDARGWPGDQRTFLADHADLDGAGGCAGPDTSRQLTTYDVPFAIPSVFDDSDVRSAGFVYWCELGGQHLMTAYDTGGYAHFDFRPDRTFTDVTEVCWNQNVTAMGGGKWTELAVVPVGVFEANGGRMDYTHPERNGPNQPGSWGLKILDGVVKVGFHGTQQSTAMDQQIWRGTVTGDTTEAKGLRTRHCVSDNGDGTVTTSKGLPSGGVHADVLPGVFPAGESVVIWSDVLYNPTKRPGNDPGETTWHWDSFFIRTG